MLKTLILSAILVGASASGALAQQDYVLRGGAPINMRPGGYIDHSQDRRGEESQYTDPSATNAGRRSYPDAAANAAKATSAALYNQRQAQQRAQKMVERQKSYNPSSPFPVGYGE